MGVYIKGMKMPKRTTDITITPDGNVIVWGYKNKLLDSTATEVLEPHGRLIDADDVMRNNLFTERDRGFLFDAPTVIESEVEE